MVVRADFAGNPVAEDEPDRTVSRAEAAAFLVRYATTPTAHGAGALPIGV